MNVFFLFTIVTTVGLSLKAEADAGSLKGRVHNLTEQTSKPKVDAFSMIIKSFRSNDVSVTYHLYTPDNPVEPCSVEHKSDATKKCSFNPNLDTKFLIHGFWTVLQPGNWFELIKDKLLESGPFNVIIVNWYPHNQPPYTTAVANSFVLGENMGSLIEYLIREEGAQPSSFHLIGHSLGAQACAIAGKMVPNMGRITALDPAAPYFNMYSTSNRLTYTDADLVDVIHTSSMRNLGAGLNSPIGDVDFYPNGGIQQPCCTVHKQYVSIADGAIKPISSLTDKAGCSHGFSVAYFMHSISSDFIGTMCDNYDDFVAGSCSDDEDAITGRMGLHHERIPDLPPMSKFYLNITDLPHICFESREAETLRNTASSVSHSSIGLYVLFGLIFLLI